MQPTTKCGLCVDEIGEAFEEVEGEEVEGAEESSDAGTDRGGLVLETLVKDTGTRAQHSKLRV